MIESKHEGAIDGACSGRNIAEPAAVLLGALQASKLQARDLRLDRLSAQRVKPGEIAAVVQQQRLDEIFANHCACPAMNQAAHAAS